MADESMSITNREQMFAYLLARMPVAVADIKGVKKQYERLTKELDLLLMRMRLDVIDGHLDGAGTLCAIQQALPEVFKCIGNSAGSANVRLVHPAMKALYDLHNTRMVIGHHHGDDNEDIIARRMNRLIADSPNVVDIRVIGGSCMATEFLVRPLLWSLGGKLQVLDLNGNGILLHCLPSLAESLVRLTGLKELKLRNNGIGAAGAAALAPSLRALTGLKELGLGENGIGAEGAAAIVRSLVTLPGLHDLCLSHNGIGLEGDSVIKGMLVGVNVH